MAATNGFLCRLERLARRNSLRCLFHRSHPDERNGNFSNATYNNGSPVEIFNPATGQQYQFNGIPTLSTRPPSAPPRSPSSNLFRSLTSPLPPPAKIFTTSPPTPANSDAVIFRLIHNSAPAPALWCLGRAGVEAVATAAVRTISISPKLVAHLHQHRESVPSLAGGTSTQGLNASAGWVYGKNRATNNLPHDL